MSTIKDLLEALNTKEAAVSTGDLATELKTSKEGTLKQLTREKDKGNVEGSSQEGWLITDAGRKALEKGDIHPSMIDEGVTPRQQFEAIGRRIGIKEDRIVLATDIVWSGDFEDVKWVWEALGQADIAKDLRSVWVNGWRAKLQKGIPPELETELTGVSKVEPRAGDDAIPSKRGGRDYIIVEDEPVRVGENLGDYSLQDAKDILGLRALRSRFSGAGQAGATGAGGTAEKVSDVLTALSPYLNKGSDIDTIKEVLADKLALQRQEILSHIPQGNPAEPKSWIEQVTGFVAAISSLKDAGPMIRSILGIPESSGGNPANTALPVQIKGPDGQPIVMDLGQVIDWRRFQGEERRADERQTELAKTAQTLRENAPDAIQALITAAQESKEERKTGTGGQPPASQQPQIKCSCGVLINLPAGEWLEIQCTNCQQVWTREQVKEALAA